MYHSYRYLSTAPVGTRALGTVVRRTTTGTSSTVVLVLQRFSEAHRYNYVMVLLVVMNLVTSSFNGRMSTVNSTAMRRLYCLIEATVLFYQLPTC